MLVRGASGLITATKIIGWPFDYTPPRERAGPEKFLVGYRAYLHADAYGGYDALFKDPARGLTEVSCWAHARRYFYKALDSDRAPIGPALLLIAQLYRVEKQARLLTVEDRLRLRQLNARVRGFRTSVDSGMKTLNMLKSSHANLVIWHVDSLFCVTLAPCALHKDLELARRYFGFSEGAMSTSRPSLCPSPSLPDGYPKSLSTQPEHGPPGAKFTNEI